MKGYKGEKLVSDDINHAEYISGRGLLYLAYVTVAAQVYFKHGAIAKVVNAVGSG